MQNSERESAIRSNVGGTDRMKKVLHRKGCFPFVMRAERIACSVDSALSPVAIGCGRQSEALKARNVIAWVEASPTSGGPGKRFVNIKSPERAKLIRCQNCGAAFRALDLIAY